MIPHRLNLISPSKRNHLKRMVSFQFTKSLLELLLIFLSVAGIVLLGGRWVLQNHFNDLTEHIVSVSNKYGETNQEIRQINITLDEADKIQKGFHLWTPLLTELSNIIPNQVVLNNISFNQEKETLTLTGNALTRDDLLELKNNLEEITWIESVNIPPEQLIEKEDIQFSISPVLQ